MKIQESKINLGPNQIRFSGELIGRSLQFTYRKIEFKICFPNFKFDSDSPRLELKGSDILLDRGKSGNYDLGSAISWNENKREVTAFKTSNLIVQNEITKSTNSKSNKAVIADWAKELVDWYATELFLDPSYAGSRVVSENITSFLVSKDKNIKPQHINQTIPTRIITEITEKRLDKKLLKSILAKISSHEKPEAEKLMLLEALIALNQMNYRSAVLCSATALEMNLINKIDIISKSGNNKNIAISQYVFNKTGIVDKVKALKKAGFDLNETQIRMKVVEPRNRAIHAGTSINEEEAKSALDCIYKILYQ